VSILRRLWERLTSAGAGSGGGAEPPRLDTVDYNGFRIRPAPYKVEAGWQTAGVIEKDFPDGPKEHSFVRAETHPSFEAAAEFSLAKGKQIVDQSGERIFVKR
jgi:hypothetical protein